MKKTTKKLVLAKETVRSLSRVDLRSVAGATYITWPCWSTPEYTCQEDFTPYTYSSAC
jgi:hypothetical protein